ncbi:MAG: hypothetical protein AAF035_00645 [Pseudomonadota bacterium]
MLTAKTTDRVLAASLAEGLKAEGALRVWSLIVTFFGDAVLPRGGRVGAAAIGDLMAAMGVEAGAVRTALSRLAKENYLLREKVGRLAYYRLARQREHDFLDASERIYGAVPDIAAVNVSSLHHDGLTASLIHPPQDLGSAERDVLAGQVNGLLLPSGLLLSAPLGLLDRVRMVQQGCLIVEGSTTNLPEWVVSHCANPRFELFEDWEQKIGQVDLSDPLACAALLCFLIHQWRRAVLRTPEVHPNLQGLTGEASARACVMRTYKRLEPLAAEWFDEAIWPDNRPNGHNRRAGSRRWY